MPQEIFALPVIYLFIGSLKPSGQVLDGLSGFLPTHLSLHNYSAVLKWIRDLHLPGENVNVNGGAIAMGHPLGATGAMILGTVLDELERRDLSTALVTLCIGVGMGTATIIERV